MSAIDMFLFNWQPLIVKLDEIRDVLLTDRARPRIVFVVRLSPYNIFKGVITMLQLADNQNCHLGPIVVLDAKNNPAKVDGAPSWSSSDPSIVTVTPSADGMEADVSAVGPLTADGASVQIVVSADADLGAGVSTITGTLDVTVVASEATQIQIPTGTPTNQ